MEVMNSRIWLVKQTLPFNSVIYKRELYFDHEEIPQTPLKPNVIDT